MAVKRTMYQREVDVDMLNTVKSALADVSSVSPSSEQNNIHFVFITSSTFSCYLVGQYKISVSIRQLLKGQCQGITHIQNHAQSGYL